MKKSLIIVAVFCAGLAPFPVHAVSIYLDVEAPSGALYTNTLDVSPCAVTTDLATTTVSAKCALEQAGLTPEWSNFGGDDLFLTTAASTTQDYANNVYWNWWSDLSYGQTALNKHELVEGESLLVALGVLPMRFGATPSVVVGATTTIILEEFGFDASYNGVWMPSASTTVVVDGVALETSSLGTLNLVATSTESLTFSASKAGFLSVTLALTPTSAATTSPVIETPAPPSIIASGGGSTSASTREFNSASALAYLTSAQYPDGSFDAPFLSDWAALAFAAGGSTGVPAAQLRSHLRSATPTLISVTDYERHAMALLALGIDPYTGTAIDYIAPIVRAFDGAQIGDVHLDNDDIFALFPLIAAGYSASDPIIAKTTAFILSAQQPNGSWDGSVDMTAAAIQALSQVDSLSGVSVAVSRATSYLHTAQQGSGGFANSFSTSWVLQAVAAFGEPLSMWAQGGATPREYLATLQQSDGGVELPSSTVQTRVWATAYAIPAALGKAWPSLLTPVSKPVTSERGALPGAVLGMATSSLPAAATSTPVEATSTSVSSSIVLRVASTTHSARSSKQKVSAPKARMSVATTSLAVATQTATTSPVTTGFWSRVWASVAAFLGKMR